MSEKMTIRQISDLVKGDVVSECVYSYEPPSSGHITDMILLILRNCSDYLRREGVPVSQSSIE